MWRSNGWLRVWETQCPPSALSLDPAASTLECREWGLLCQWSSSEHTGVSFHQRTKKTSKHENIKCLVYSLYLLCFFKYLMCLGIYFMMFPTLNITQKGKGMLGYCRSHKRSIDHSLIEVVILRWFVPTIQSPAGSHYVSTILLAINVKTIQIFPFPCTMVAPFNLTHDIIENNDEAFAYPGWWSSS